MKTTSAISTVCLALVASTNAFSTSSSFSGSQVISPANNNALMTMEYIPSGMSKEQWQKLKNAEKNKFKGKNLGANGITTFKSRSFADWQKSGGKNLFPVDPRKVKDPSEIPYMQRPGGAPDNSDLKKKAAFSVPFGKKKQEPAAPPAPEKKKNWWTL
mmetsp:Transcript_101485/g.199097  ORF Transcript_101485/g.199097 Transcript_101485/m.199097 type:complete len:158 (-) Transcript_101485:566-1039(-)|eukprot:CAMPEP_0170265022 /NCGR_PEP_ID=MMETSP0116_2-20130129/32416_1 /TAXON_ID=400756 /ORGANISM="Durinskia baltica, Strain CSIRO CS-38" /LENGTH=157 /DNA_ID=CAMNT_0010516135 /DNA_START=177 /DNA_END=650 /DNA_ORIENTATION=+